VPRSGRSSEPSEPGQRSRQPVRRRRIQGEGTLFFDRRHGLWTAEVTLGVGPDGRRRRKRVTSRDKAEVVRKLAVLRAAAAKGEDADRTGTEAWLVAWLTELAPARRSANTIANYRWAFEKWVIPNVGRIPLADFGPGDLDGSGV